LKSCAELAARIVVNVMDRLMQQTERIGLPAAERRP
jgi:hypothetical protein